MTHKDEMKLNEELSRNVYMGGTTLTPKPKTRLCFRGKELKKLVSTINDEDTLVFTAWSDFSEECEKENYYSKWSIIKHKSD